MASEFQKWAYGFFKEITAEGGISRDYTITLCHIGVGSPIATLVYNEVTSLSPDSLIRNLRSENGQTVFDSRIEPHDLEFKLFAKSCALDIVDLAEFCNPAPPGPEFTLDDTSLDLGESPPSLPRRLDGRIVGIDTATKILGIPEMLQPESSGSETHFIQCSTTADGDYDTDRFETPVSDRLAAERAAAEDATRQQQAPDWRQKIAAAARKLGMTEEQFVAVAIPLVIAILAVSATQLRKH